MPSQRMILSGGLAALLLIIAASIGFNVKSRVDEAAVKHTLEVLNEIAQVHILIRHAESTSRGYALTGVEQFRQQFGELRHKIPSEFADLSDKVRDNPAQLQLVRSTADLAERRLDVAGNLVRLRAEGRQDEITALFQSGIGRQMMQALDADLDQLVAAENALLSRRTASSRWTGEALLVSNICGALLILLLAALLLRGTQRSKRQLETSLSSTQIAKQSLEAAVRQQTQHLLAANEQLRDTLAALQGTFNSMADAVVVMDRNGRIMHWNPAAEQLLRFKPGMKLEQLRAGVAVYRADGITPLTAGEMPSVKPLNGEPLDNMEILVRPLADRPPRRLVVSGRPLRDASGGVTGAALVYRDITAARETEHQLQQAQKLDAIGKLTGGVAHDVNNMLTVITGVTETLIEGLQRQPELLGFARLVSNAADRCADLIRHLLAFARKQPLQPRDVDINAAIDEVARLLRPTLGEQIEIATMLTDGVVASHIDPSQLANAVLNLAINARDAMPNGGKLLLETADVVLDEAYAEENREVRPGRYVMVAVSDTGTGMPQAVQDRAFEPFFTTKGPGKGSGLGLSMVYGFVKQSGGHIKIYSEQGHGTTIRLYLPPATGKAAAPLPPSTAITGGTETILVVEDDALVRGLAIVQLQSLGYRTLEAADCRAALAYLDSGEPFDLLFTDVVMPGGMTGRELADTVTSRRPDCKVLYTSGYTENAIVHHGRLDPGVLLLTKPYRRAELDRMVRLALRGGDQVSTSGLR